MACLLARVQKEQLQGQLRMVKNELELHRRHCAEFKAMLEISESETAEAQESGGRLSRRLQLAQEVHLRDSGMVQQARARTRQASTKGVVDGTLRREARVSRGRGARHNARRKCTPQYTQRCPDASPRRALRASPPCEPSCEPFVRGVACSCTRTSTAAARIWRRGSLRTARSRANWQSSAAEEAVSGPVRVQSHRQRGKGRCAAALVPAPAAHTQPPKPSPMRGAAWCLTARHLTAPRWGLLSLTRWRCKSTYPPPQPTETRRGPRCLLSNPLVRTTRSRAPPRLVAPLVGPALW